MPEVKVCSYCNDELDTERDKYVVVAKAHQGKPEQIDHLECNKKRGQQDPF